MNNPELTPVGNNGFFRHPSGYLVSHRATGWYFPETIRGVEPLPDPEGTLETPSREELIKMIEEGTAYHALQETVERPEL